MALNFPPNPNSGDRWTVGTKTYQWSGSAWLVAIQNNISSGIITITSSTNATSTTTGALVVTGGIGLGGDLWIGGTIYSGSAPVLTTSSLGGSVFGGTDISITNTGSSGTSFLRFDVISTLQSVTDRGHTTTNLMVFSNATESVSTITGALQVAGGVGIQKDLWVGGGINGNLIGGSTGALVYQSSTSTTAFLTIGSSGQLLTVVDGIPSWTSLGALSTATSLAAGAAGQVPYQTGPGVTSFTAVGTAGTILTSNGTGSPTWNNTLTLTSTVSAISTITGALQVVGGVGVGGDVWAGNIVTGPNQYIHFGGTTGTRIYRDGGSNGMSLQTNSLSRLFISDSGPVTVLSTASSTSTTTGALTVIGGVGIGGNLYVGGNITVSGTINASVTTATSLASGTAGQVPYQTAPGVTSFYGPGTAGNVLVSNGTSAPTYNNTLTLVGTTAASSTATGALQVRGGVGIGGDLFLGGNFTQVGGTYATLAATYNLINTTATTVNFAGAGTTITIGASASGTTTIRNNLTVAGNLTVQGTTTIVDSTVTNIVDPIITLGGLANNAAPIADDNKDRGIAFKYVSAGSTSTGLFGYDDSTGYLTYVPIATITNEVVSGTKGAIDANLAGGTAMSLVYQSAVDTTAFLAASTAGYILQTNGTGTAPSWVSATGISVGSATYADSVRTISQNSNTTYFPTFVDSNNASNTYELVYTTSSFTINPGTGLATHAFTNAVNTVELLRLSNPGAGANTQAQMTFYAAGGLYGSITGGYGTVAPQMVFNLPSATTGNYIWQNNSVEQLRINTAGQVGVGSNYAGTSGSLFAVNGAAYINGAFTATGVSYFGSNVGVGTTTPATYGTFVVSHTGSSTTGIVVGDIVTPANATGIYLRSTTTASIAWASGAALIFTQGAGGTEKLRITASGGIAFNGASNYGSSGQILQSNGDTAPTWVSVSGLTAGTATTATQVNTILQAANASYFPTFVDSNNATATGESIYTTSSFSINPSTGVVIFGSTTAATSTATGALQVRGGVGIGGGLYVGGNASLLGNKLATKYLTLSPNTIATDVSSLGAYIQLGNPVSNQPPDVCGIQFANYSGSGTGLAAIRYNNGGANYGLELDASTLSSDKIRLVAGATGGVIVTSLTNATSTTTGALQVVGGVGIGGGLFVGGTMTATSAQITTGLSVGATAPSATAGEIRATNEITAYYSSDRRLKENIKLIADPITIVNQIRGVRFDWTDEHIQKRGGEDGYFVRKHDIGVIAQEVEAVLPEIVATRDDGTKVVKYEKLVALLIEAVKEQQKQINQISQALERLASK